MLLDVKPLELSNAAFEVFGLVKYTKQSIFLTGEAGTGKSTLIEVIEKYSERNILKLAFSGIAAQNIGGSTIHSTFQIPVQIPKDVYRLSYSIRMKLLATDLIIIDEISFVSKELFDFLDKLMRYNLNNNSPFGGLQMLLIGDLFQLPPVKNNAMFFESKKFKMNHFEYITLTEIYRQKDIKFCNILNKLRIGQTTEQEINALNKICFGKKLNEAIRLTCNNQNSSYYNKLKLDTINEKEWVFEGVINGSFNIKDVLTPQILKLKVGARVMITKNNSKEEYYNGTQGTVKHISDEFIIVISDDGKEFKIYREKWNKIDPITEKEVGSFCQFPLILGWAITIHKSQGLTFDNVEIDLGWGAFECGQLYTAISRCRTLEGLSFFTPIKSKDVIVNQKSIEFMSKLNSEIQREISARNLNILIEILDEREKAGFDY